MDTNELLPRDNGAKFLHVPYDERWNYLRPVITQLYMGKYGPDGKSTTISQVAGFMKSHYSFHAAETQYRRHFREWGVRKRTLATEKQDIISVLGRRSRADASTSNVTLGEDKQVNKKQLKRHLKDEIRHWRVEPLTPGVLTSWNLPYDALAKAHGVRANAMSPFRPAAPTPAYLHIHSPKARTPGRTPPGPSPTMQLVQQKAAQDRSSMMLQGRIQQLLSSCGREDRVTLVNYFHDFYIHSFMTAKYWGKGPQQWTPGLVSAFTLGGFEVPTSPSITHAPSPSETVFQRAGQERHSPTQLCRWVIHIPEVQYEAIPEAQVDGQPMFDIQNPSSWAAWQQPKHDSLADSMNDSIVQNTFSATPTADLPISTDSISQSVRQDPRALMLDALRMAIMAGNPYTVLDVLDTIFNSVDIRHDDIHIMYPFHLAAAFLDGGNTCCATFWELRRWFNLKPGDNVNDIGHTILDSLMISILRSHTTLSPEHVSAAFEPPSRYPGEEKDICGRWDADSPLIRSLFRQGYARVPSQWKHPFCHSSIQAVCHSIIVIFTVPGRPDINFHSGLFTRRCGNCGLELKLGPLHTLIVVAFYLAQLGMPGETLFGPLAILVCLLRVRANVSMKVMVSVDAILGTAESDICKHDAINASELLQAVPAPVISEWSPACQTGWKCISEVLLAAREEEHSDDGEDELEGGGAHFSICRLDSQYDMRFHGDNFLTLPPGTPKLSLLWAAIQTELLTYRRIQPNDSWISGNFSMDALRAWLTGDEEAFSTSLVTEGLMDWNDGRSCCGWLNADGECFIPVASEVCTRHFMNMDVYERTTFLPQPDILGHIIEGGFGTYY